MNISINKELFNQQNFYNFPENSSNLQIFPFLLNLNYTKFVQLQNKLKMTSNTNIATIGIDLGSYASKIAAAQRGGIDIITNQANFRETPSIVGYGLGQRKIGEAGNVRFKTNFKDSIVSPMRFFAKSGQCLKMQSKYCQAKITDDQFQVKYQGKTIQLVPQQVTASYLNKLKSIIDLNELNALQIVLSVPTYYTQAQRQSLLDSAAIAGINITKIINESCAVLLDYGISRRSQLQQPRNVLFIDFGHSKFSTYLAQLHSESASIIQQSHERNLGCRNIDILLLEFYQKIFLKKSGLDVFENKKSIVKLMQNIEKQRKILSGNQQHELNIQYLMEEDDLQYIMNRQKFEQIARPVFNEITNILNHIKQLILKSKIPIHSIQLIGGGTRIPFFIQLVKKIFNRQPSRTLNSSEVIAKGCAIMATSKSKVFRTPKYDIKQRINLGVIISWNPIIKNHCLGFQYGLYTQKNRRMLFERNEIHQQRQLKIEHKGPLQILLSYEDYIPGMNQSIGYYITKPEFKDNTHYSTIVRFSFDQNGLLVLKQCLLQQIQRKQDLYYDNSFNGFGSHHSGFFGQRPKTYNHTLKRNKPLEVLQLNYEYYLPKMLTVEQLSKFKSLQYEMSIKDKIILETYEAKNKLQSQIYMAKQKIQSFPIQNKQAIQLLDAMNNWLYEDGQNATKQIYQMKLNEVQSIFKPYCEKYAELETIKEEIAKLDFLLKQNANELNSTQSIKFSALQSQQRQNLKRQIESFNTWKIQHQSSHNLTLEEIRQKNEQLNQIIEFYLNTPEEQMNQPQILEA